MREHVEILLRRVNNAKRLGIEQPSQVGNIQLKWID